MNITTALDRRHTVGDQERRIGVNDIHGRWFRQVNNSNVFVIEKPQPRKMPVRLKAKQVAITPFKGTIHGHRPIAQKAPTTIAHERRDTIAMVNEAPYYRYDLFGYWADEMRDTVYAAFWSAWKNRKPIPKPQQCKFANKREYSHAGAKRALATAIKIGNDYAPKRMYQCEHCKKYHLTSKV